MKKKKMQKLSLFILMLLLYFNLKKIKIRIGKWCVYNMLPSGIITTYNHNLMTCYYKMYSFIHTKILYTIMSSKCFKLIGYKLINKLY